MNRAGFVVLNCVLLLSCECSAAADVIIRKCDSPFDTVVARFLAAVDANANVGLALDFDHAANARRVGLELEPTRVFLFGNPKVGTALMQESGAAAVDLPVKALVFAREGATFYAYSPAAFLGRRHELRARDSLESLHKLDAALKAFATASCSPPVRAEPRVPSQIRQHAAGLLQASAAMGLITKASAYSVRETLDRLEAAYADAPISTVLRVDHAASARRVGLPLAPTETLLFGNPALGTPLMAHAASIGLDFPQKAAAWTQAGRWRNGTLSGRNRTLLTYNDPVFFARRHRLPVDEFAELLATIRAALDRLTDRAVGRDG